MKSNTIFLFFCHLVYLSSVITSLYSSFYWEWRSLPFLCWIQIVWVNMRDSQEIIYVIQRHSIASLFTVTLFTLCQRCIHLLLNKLTIFHVCCISINAFYVRDMGWLLFWTTPREHNVFVTEVSSDCNHLLKMDLQNTFFYCRQIILHFCKRVMEQEGIFSLSC